MGAQEILTLDEGTPQIEAPQTGDTYIAPVTLQAATGNEIAFDLTVIVNKATSGNDTLFRIVKTDTNSPGISMFLELLLGATTKVSLTDGGLLTVEGLLAKGVFNNQIGTTYTILAADNGKILTFNNASAVAVTLPDGLDVDFQCTIVQIGAGVVTVTPNTDTVNGAGTGVFPTAQWKGMYLSQYASTTWLAVL